MTSITIQQHNVPRGFFLKSYESTIQRILQKNNKSYYQMLTTYEKDFNQKKHKQTIQKQLIHNCGSRSIPKHGNQKKNKTGSVNNEEITALQLKKENETLVNTQKVFKKRLKTKKKDKTKQRKSETKNIQLSKNQKKKKKTNPKGQNQKEKRKVKRTVSVQEMRTSFNQKQKINSKFRNDHKTKHSKSSQNLLDLKKGKRKLIRRVNKPRSPKSKSQPSAKQKTKKKGKRTREEQMKMERKLRDEVSQLEKELQLKENRLRDLRIKQKTKILKMNSPSLQKNKNQSVKGRLRDLSNKANNLDKKKKANKQLRTRTLPKPLTTKDLIALKQMFQKSEIKDTNEIIKENKEFIAIQKRKPKRKKKSKSGSTKKKNKGNKKTFARLKESFQLHEEEGTLLASKLENQEKIKNNLESQLEKQRMESKKVEKNVQKMLELNEKINKLLTTGSGFDEKQKNIELLEKIKMNIKYYSNKNKNEKLMLEENKKKLIELQDLKNM
ncbi:hypothetical protein M0813_02804 [Anaeramoeba flamelloides]|uniref:Uncharacterized protein n=1 Tax=Anaeramoeba flamelloides TaxID=1746091 RepID=A0ABQ8YEA8_9EUKA|nr:hypothetical protein M0813_02804 [Anaeramoeba flamelloides]